LPETMANLKRLTELNLSENQLTALPEVVTQLTQLTELNLEGNQLSTLPESFKKLVRLEELYLNRNRFETIPDVLFGLNQLWKIVFGYPLDKDDSDDKAETNTIKVVPREILQLTNLVRLGLDSNPVESPPCEIAMQGIDAIRKYFAEHPAEVAI